MTPEVFLGGSVKDGRLTVSRDDLSRLVPLLPDGPVTIRIGPPKRKRSLDQNAYLHAGPFPILADHFGYTIPELKIVLMGECFGWQKLGGHDVPVKPNTSDMTVEDCTYFIDWLLPWAMTNHGVALPLPDERGVPA